MKRFKQYSILFVVLLISNIRSVNAQITYTRIDEMIDSAVHHYNSFRDYTQKLNPKIITQADVDNVVLLSGEINTEFSRIMRISSGEQKSVAAYFQALTLYERGYIYGMKGDLEKGYETMQQIEAYMLSQSAANFPKKYLFEGKNYSVKWENFAPTLKEFYSGMAEFTLNEGAYDRCKEFTRYALGVDYTTTDTDGKLWFEYIALTKYIDATKKSGVYADDAFAYANKFNYAYAQLSEEYKKLIAEYNYPSHVTGFEFLSQVASNRPDLATGYAWSTAGGAFVLLKDNAKTTFCYNKALDLNYNEDVFITLAYAHATLTDDDALGLKTCAVDEARISSSDCARWSAMAINWRNYGGTDKAKAAEEKSSNCYEEQRRAQEEAEARAKKLARKENRNASFYAGVYPVPLICRYDHYRDYGGVVGIGMWNVCIEGSYKLINRNIVVFDDLSYQEVDSPDERMLWDGYRAHIAFKFGERDNYSDDNFFVGPVFELVEKSMLGIKSGVSEQTSGFYLGDQWFYPTEKSYNAYLNMGSRIEENHWMFEYFMGIGVTYSMFDIGNADFDNETYLFSNNLLEYRKAERFGPIIRLGCTFGFTTEN